MWKTFYVVSFMTTNGIWIEMPKCESEEVCAELVRVLLKCTKVEGHAVSVYRYREQSMQ